MQDTTEAEKVMWKTALQKELSSLESNRVYKRMQRSDVPET